jgi:uncharacterized protein with HEPN domain
LPFRDPRKSLRDILDNIERIERFTDGMDYAAFCNSEATIFAVQYALLAITEAAHRLGDFAEAFCPGQPWRDIRGLGNRLRHGYDAIDLDLIWATVKSGLPPLKSDVLKSLCHLPPG